jgi:hypothetical protein
LSFFKPCKQSILPFAQRIDVPGGDLHVHCCRGLWPPS